MSRRLESIHALALHASTPEAEWQAAAIAYFRILRTGKKDEPKGIRMEAPGFYNEHPFYPFGAAATREAAEARRNSEFYRSEEYMQRRDREREAERVRKENDRRNAEMHETMRDTIDAMRAAAFASMGVNGENYSAEFKERWHVPPSDDFVRQTNTEEPLEPDKK